MPQLPHVYDLLKYKYKSAKKLAKMAGLSESSMSRILADKAELDHRPARKLATALERDLAGSGIAFFKAYLRDQLPPKLRGEITIVARGDEQACDHSNANNDPALRELVKLCATFSMMPDEVKGTIRKYAEFFLKEPSHATLLVRILDVVFNHFEEETVAGASKEQLTVLKKILESPPDEEKDSGGRTA